MPRKQTLNAQTHKEKGRPRFMRFGKMPISPGQKREIYWWFTQDYKRITLGSLENTLRNHSYPKMSSHPLFIERRRNPQINSKSGLEIDLTWLAGRPTQVCSRLPGRQRKVLQDCRAY